ncbi:hypothetical protein L1987_06592 [Smallanthus sonchifolius]|uniref:Uncharacterized protein n=1 Tax=Smallanthus sonchifolius TaxID=185202 RepID=A0ACB9JYS4_9ASTR|nr:hypothetical protein L1987_06592 [Smallanthus sonchifolius]
MMKASMPDLLPKALKKAKEDEVADSMMWNELKTLVIKKFCPRNEIEKVEREFLGLKAGSMTHRQYTTRFNELARLLPHLITTEERNIVCYIQGLPEKVRTYVKSNAPTTYDSVVELSCVVFDDLALNVVAIDEPKKKLSFPAKRLGGKLFGAREKHARVGETTVCGKYGGRHAGENGGRWERERLGDESTFILNNTFVSVLFDSGASKSFISTALCKKVKYAVSKLERAFSVETVEGRTTRLTDVVDDPTIKIEGHRFPVHLFVMVLGGFDVVLGTDWLTTNKAQIICKRTIIRLKAPDGSKVDILGDHDVPMPNVISMIKEKDYMRRGCDTYLVYVIDKRKEVKELGDVPVVREYPEVFPEDFPRIQPD